ncbi:hypothetical protein Bbelb_415250 [Branchiostoma belcheri]|nr:hypothetical protein Bbelb_415250 [Branchiostoma belcheri]
MSSEEGVPGSYDPTLTVNVKPSKSSPSRGKTAGETGLRLKLLKLFLSVLLGIVVLACFALSQLSAISLVKHLRLQNNGNVTCRNFSSTAENVTCRNSSSVDKLAAGSCAVPALMVVYMLLVPYGVSFLRSLWNGAFQDSMPWPHRKAIGLGTTPGACPGIEPGSPDSESNDLSLRHATPRQILGSVFFFYERLELRFLLREGGGCPWRGLYPPSVESWSFGSLGARLRILSLTTMDLSQARASMDFRAAHSAATPHDPTTPGIGFVALSCETSVNEESRVKSLSQGYKIGGMSGLEPGASWFRVEYVAATPQNLTVRGHLSKIMTRRDLIVRTPRGTPPVAGIPPGHISYVTDQMNRIKPMPARLLNPAGASRGYIPNGHRRNWDLSFIGWDVKWRFRVLGETRLEHVKLKEPTLRLLRFFSENVWKEWRRRTPLARHSHGFARCKRVVCTPRLAVSGCVHHSTQKHVGRVVTVALRGDGCPSTRGEPTATIPARGVPTWDPPGSPLDPARDPVAARPDCICRSAPYRTPHKSRRETDRASDGWRTLGVMTPAMPTTCDSSFMQLVLI